MARRLTASPHAALIRKLREMGHTTDLVCPTCKRIVHPQQWDAHQAAHEADKGQPPKPTP